MHAFMVLVTIVSLFSMVFWMVIGVRAVRAHEGIARGVEDMADTMRERGR